MHILNIIGKGALKCFAVIEEAVVYLISWTLYMKAAVRCQYMIQLWMKEYLWSCLIAWPRCYFKLCLKMAEHSSYVTMYGLNYPML